jgi:GntR family transcriptional regulator, arabinose operon transcriptional repressor
LLAKLPKSCYYSSEARTGLRKYTEILDTLKRDIAVGRFAANRRLPSEAELSRRYDVSRPTAARALRELQIMGLITRRAGSGSYPVEPDTRSSGAMTLSLFVPGLTNTEILDPICREINRYSQSLGHRVLAEPDSRSGISGDEAFNWCRQVIEQRVRGVFFAPLESLPDRGVWNQRIANEFSIHGIPLVLLDRDVGEFPARSAYDLVGIDNLAAAIELTDHLLSAQRRRICFVARPHYPSTTDLRLLGCRESVRRHGIARGIARTCMAAEFGDPTTQAFVDRVLARHKPDAIVCSNDQTAALLIQTLGLIGVRIPAEIAIAGFDDVQYATLLAPPLTTIRQPCQDIGASAVRVLLERIQQPALPPRLILHRHELVIRDSTRQ